MQIKKKTMQNDGWFRIIEKRYISKTIQMDDDKGVVSLNIWDKVIEPLIVSNSRYDIKIVDNGYKWIQIALEKKHFWLTAMYDSNDNLIEVYFDITRDNYFDDINDSYCYDLFSDIVITNNKEIYILDEDELQMALEENTINKDEYDMVKKTTKELYSYLLDNKENVIAICQKYLIELEKDLNVKNKKNK